MGWVYWWSRLAALAPGLANFFSQTPGLSAVAKWVGGIAQERSMPPVATEPFKEWFRKRPPHNLDRPPVILWADTFNNYFHPWVAQAAVEVLEHAGYQVWVPRAALCCGRPLYDFGMLDDAKVLLRQILETLRPQIQADIPVIGLEPSCLVVFRDELTNLFPNDKDAQRLSSNSFMLSEFLNKKVEGYRPPPLHRKALAQGHCHHKSVIGMDDEMAILHKMGLEYDAPDPGCCGMAGSFGFEHDHYDISMKVGEQRLLPAVRRAGQDTLVVANGFSCKEQIRQGAGRDTLHLAEVIRMALHEEQQWPGGTHRVGRYPGHESGGPNGHTGRRLAQTAALAGAGLVVGGLLLWGAYGRRGR
jgi:Fe-S oxidoreductase